MKSSSSLLSRMRPCLRMTVFLASSVIAVPAAPAPCLLESAASLLSRRSISRSSEEKAASLRPSHRPRDDARPLNAPASLSDRFWLQEESQSTVRLGFEIPRNRFFIFLLGSGDPEAGIIGTWSLERQSHRTRRASSTPSCGCGIRPCSPAPEPIQPRCRCFRPRSSCRSCACVTRGQCGAADQRSETRGQSTVGRRRAEGGGGEEGLVTS